MFQAFNMPLHRNQTDALCFDCVYMHKYVINGCSHTICLTCMYEAIEEKIRRQSKTFICPRCIDFEERQIRLGQSIIGKSSEVNQETATVVQSLKVEQETSSGQKSEPILMLKEEHDADSYWPLGTESWYIHEIKPQRELYAHKAPSEKLMISQTTTNNDKPHRLEDPPQSATNSQRGYTEPQAVKLDNQPQSVMTKRLYQLDSAKTTSYASQEPSQHLKTTISIDNQNISFKQTPKIINMHYTSKLPQDRNRLIPNTRLHKLSLSSSVSTTTAQYNNSSNHLLRRIGKVAVFLIGLLVSIIIQIEIVHDFPHYTTDDHNQPVTIESKLIVNTTPSIDSKRYFRKFISYTKTIEILRNLESLLIYGLT